MSRVLDRVRKLIALAGSNPSEAEARAAMLQAQRLMAEHQISETDVVCAEEQEELAILDIEVAGKRSKDYETLSAIIARNFRCRTALNTKVDMYGTKTVALRFVGLASDAAAATVVYGLAKHSLLTNRAAYMKERKRKTSFRNASFSPNDRDVRVVWTHAFLFGLQEAFTQQVATNNWAMVLMTPALVLAYNDKLKSARKLGTKTVGRIDRDAAANGDRAGRVFAEVSRQKAPENFAVKQLGVGK